MRYKSFLITCLALVLLAVPAQADELWVAPGGQVASSGLGDWATTPNGATHFSFAVPDDLESLDGASVVVIGKKDRTLDWQAAISISQDGMAHDAITGGDSGQASLGDGVVTEIDVSAALPSLVPGADLVAIRFDMAPPGQVVIVGLRIRYTAPDPLAEAGCAPGELLVGFGAGGAAQCTTLADELADVGCDAGDVLTGFDETGAPVCATVVSSLAGVGCPVDQVLNGFDSAGDPICVTVGGGDTGGGGGGGEPGGGGGGGGGEVTVSIGDASELEGDSGTSSIFFQVTVTGTRTLPLTVDYTTQDGTATVADGDYQAASGTVTIPATLSSGLVIVTINGDNTEEPNETFQVILSNPSEGTISDDTGVGTIQNDDSGDGRG
jgi:hypothetical protein